MFGAIGLADFPFGALRVDECRKVCGVAQASWGEVAVSSNLAGEVVDRFAVTGDPDLAGRKVEVKQIVDRLGREETADLVSDNFAADVYHLDVGHVVTFFVIADAGIILFVQSDTFLKVIERLVGILVLVVGT